MHRDRNTFYSNGRAYKGKENSRITEILSDSKLTKKAGTTPAFGFFWYNFHCITAGY